MRPKEGQPGRCGLRICVPEEMRKESLDDYRMHLLKELKEWIYRRRVKGREERRRAERARARAEAEAKAPEQLRLGL